ncbi:T9SS type A sorting domain-containing protein [Flavobacterium sp.]|uniref:T9SS type A sorting domain-containing protein n=1 Tax=Flavobacterium sp. TaxID=239 RepID=UPI00262C4A3C|nr:T9SS type A sorting domain-containing protein [Flavobacterium sp.]
MKRTLLLVVSLFSTFVIFSQSKRVLFLGNSYTQVNDLPQLLLNIGQSTNDIFIVDSNTPGGHTLQQHNSNPTSLSKINEGNWDFVVLQEQSQLPSFPINQVNTQVFPFAQSLNNLIVSQNPCAETVFYMTWGRQNGDSSNCDFFPPLCTYEGMDDLLRERYMMMTVDNNAITSPVGAVWRYIRNNIPSLNLYSSDGSHPSITGSYVAACTFYTTLTRKDPTLITFNSSLSSAEAMLVKLAVKNIVYEHLTDWKIGNYDTVSNFSYSNVTSSEISFDNNSLNANQYEWDFGDGTTSNDENPTHNFLNEGEYTVTLNASKCGNISYSQQTILISNLNGQEFNIKNLELYPNPTNEELNIISNEIIDLVSLYDVNGRLIETIENNNNKITINFSNKKEGFYIVKMNSNGEIYTKKIIKN